MQDDKNKQQPLSWSSESPLVPGPAASEPAKAPAKPEAGKPMVPALAWAPGTQAPVYAGLLVGGIIVGVLLAHAWASMGRGAPAGGTAATTTQSSGTTTAASGGAAAKAPVAVSDQKAGSTVVLNGLNLARPTWVVVYVSREGKPGNALGARLYFQGDKQGQVSLLRDTEPGQSYFVGLSADNGDRVFSLSADKPVADADGGPLWATFQAL